MLERRNENILAMPDREDKIPVYIQKMIRTEEYLEEHGRALEDIIKSIGYDDMGTIMFEIGELYKYIRSYEKTLEFIINELPVKREKIEMFGVIEEKSVLADIDYDIPAIKLSFDHILPHRKKIDRKNILEYRLAIKEALSGKIKDFNLFEPYMDDKIVIRYRFYFDQESKILDSDNIYTKHTTDILTSLFLKGDSMRYLSTVIEGILDKGGIPRTTIELFPQPTGILE